MLFDRLFQEELMALLAMDSVTPMETGLAVDLAAANGAFAALAKRVGMRVRYNGPGSLDGAEPSNIPLSVQRRAGAMPDFFEGQPNLVLEIGEGGPDRTVMFNFHMDTVSPHLPASRDGDVIRGRGAVDNKGPGVAVLAALDRLREERPELLRKLRVLIQSVSGEEGGAMGVYGTRHLVSLGHVGRLNVFVEPTQGRYFDASTCSMTFEVAFDGAGSTDDFPERGDNATVALGFIAQSMAARLAVVCERIGMKLTVAGLHTGLQHNRVYGEGRLLLNLAYTTQAAGLVAIGEVESAFVAARETFVREFGSRPVFARTASRLRETCKASWLKAGLPVLNNRDAEMEAVLAGIGLHRNEELSESFTCDAIWAQAPGRYSIVFGPGSLADNGAHTAGEHVHLAELEEFSQAVLRLLIAFATTPSSTPPN